MSAARLSAFCCPLLVLAFVARSLRAAVSLPAIFGSNMVLQCEMPVPIWGRAAPGEKVAVEFGGQRVEAVAGADGAWRLTLVPLPAGDTPLTMRVVGTNTLTLENILAGEVWLCSGQSNMTLSVASAERASEEIATARFPRIRFFTVARAADESAPLADVKGRWVECNPATVGDFSAVGFFMGRRLHETLRRPVGLIHSSWGGTAAEAWTPRETLANDPALKPILDRWAQSLDALPRLTAEFEANRERLLAEWREASAQAIAEGRAPPVEPRVRIAPNSQYAPVALYNGMIAPLVPFALRGFAWYQGESHAGRADEYRRLFPAMIGAWRAAWERDVPFVFVQLPNFARRDSRWPGVRQAQRLTLAMPHTEMVVTIDVGDPTNLHPKNKQPVGLRLALAAENLAYGFPASDRLSPLFQSATFENDGRVRIHFAPGRGWLEAPANGAPLRGFEIAGADRKYFAAEALIENGTVIARSDRVPTPVSVRYAWADNPSAANLFSTAGLPASPFRSDDRLDDAN